MEAEAKASELEERSAGPWGLPALILSLLVLVYLGTMPVSYARGDPAWEHTLALRSGAELVRPNHLLTSSLNWLVLQAVPAGHQRAGMIALQLLEILAASLAAFWLYRLLERAAPESSYVLPALLLTFFLTYGVWMHAVTAETGMVPLALLIASLAILRIGSEDRASLGRTAAAFSTFSLGVLFAFNQVLLAPALLAFVALCRLWARSRSAHLLTALGTMLLVGAVPYVAVAVTLFNIRSPHQFFQWLTDHPDREALSHLTLGFDSVFRSASGLLNLLVDVRGANTFVRLLLTGGDVGSFDPLLLGRLAAGAGIAGLLLALAWIGSRGDRGLAAGCWLALAATLMFGIFWLGSDPQFWLPALPFLSLLAARGAASLARTRWRNWVLGAGWATAAALPLLNLPVLGPSLLLPSGGPEDRTAREMAARLRPGDLILHPGATHGASWVFAVAPLRRDVRILSMVGRKDFRGRQAAAFQDELYRSIDDHLRARRRVYVDGLVGPPRPEHVGPWETIKNFRGCSRSDLAARLSERYGVRSFRTRSGGEHITVIQEKSGQGP